MKASASSVIARRILMRQSSPGHKSAVSRQTETPAPSSTRCNLSTSCESSRTYEMKACPVGLFTKSSLEQLCRYATSRRESLCRNGPMVVAVAPAELASACLPAGNPD